MGCAPRPRGLPAASSRRGRATIGHEELIGLIDQIYEAALDGGLWPGVLIKLADAIGAAHVSITSRDLSANTFASITPRTDPDFVASYREYWAFHNPLIPGTALRPVGEIYSLDSLMAREDFSATPVCNEWWLPSGRGLGSLGANLLVEDQFSALICVANAPDEDGPTVEQTRVFEVALRHIIRAMRISRQFWALDLGPTTAPEQLENRPQAIFLAGASARVVFANAAAKAMLDAGDGMLLRDGRLATADGSDALAKLIASCARTSPALGGPGGELTVPRDLRRPPLQVTVTPLRSKAQLAHVPWIGVGPSIAVVTVNDPDSDRRRREINLRRRFGLTAAETGLAAEILHGHGRKAAARRRGISDATAKKQLSSIFEKTGTHRQAELVRFLLDATAAKEVERGNDERFPPRRRSG
jgi:DNA-binding CsgD family transcriptional regulator